jgi:glutathione S-transferase
MLGTSSRVQLVAAASVAALSVTAAAVLLSVSRRRKSTSYPDATLYATLACPYAHRAMLALALRPVPGIKLKVGVPTLNQLNYLDNLGVGNLGGDPLSSFTGEPGTTVADLHSRKENYKRNVIASGETPALKFSGSGEVVYESEIVCEFLDASSTADGPHKLVPVDPLLASRMRISMKKFNAVPAAIIKLLKNQNPADDAEKIKSLNSVLSAFAATLEDDSSAQFCHGGVCTLADIHCGPFLFRFDPVLRYYRNYDLVGTHPRLAGVLAALKNLPEWQAVMDVPPAVSAESLVTFYAQYANGSRWGDGGNGQRVLVGRGAA